MDVTKIIKIHGQTWGLQDRGDLGHPLPRYFIRGPRGAQSLPSLSSWKSSYQVENQPEDNAKVNLGNG